MERKMLDRVSKEAYQKAQQSMLQKKKKQARKF